jgi:protein-arginine kinase
MTDFVLPDGADLPWLDATGPESELVISTRVRLARNLAGHPFWGRNTADQRDAMAPRAPPVAGSTSGS